MSAPARLLALRLQGFKSFAERTVVEFGPGISAIVGPNGSGKSNLADALRWTLGEQGRALRSRKSEDVIFAGSERRAALGMADVTLVLDNADGLLPVEYAVLELGRRLYRSGENDYLLNKQRVRLRDLVDLLDSAHLADNAFLFIGQGMVDQALALRPEERRPLFEEVAGVRRHERRRRKAEEQLAEAEVNLARVDDILAELRPQARRLAAQAEQQVSRASAGDELAAALVVAAHARWHDAALRRAATVERLGRARTEVERASSELAAAEREAAAISAARGARIEAERIRREAHEVAQAAHTELQLREARMASDLAGLVRDWERLRTEREAAEADLAVRRREAATPVPATDPELQAAVAEAERALAEALEEIGALRAARQAHGDELATIRRAEAARVGELELARRRLAEAERQSDEERERAEGSAQERLAAETAHAEAAALASSARNEERTAVAAREAARASAERAEGASRASTERATAAVMHAAGLRGSLEALRARLAEEEARGIARAARRIGGRRLDEELQVEPAFRAAVESALGEMARAYLVRRDAVAQLRSERGTLVVDDADRPLDPPEPAFRARLAAAGGGILVDAIRHDPGGAARRILARAAWVPDLDAVVELQAELPDGWIVVSRDGGAAAGPIAIGLGRAEGPLERRAQLERMETQLAEAEADAADLERAAAVAAGVATEAREALEAARQAEAAVVAGRRTAEDAERASGRAAERLAREATWHAALTDRAEAGSARLRDALAQLESAAAERSRVADAAARGGTDDPSALASWEARAADLRSRRDRLAGALVTADGARREAEAIVARAVAAAAYDQERIARTESDERASSLREAELAAERERLAVDAAAAEAREIAARAALEGLRSADAVDRDRSEAAEAAATAARERLRAADERVRAAEVADLEMRLGLDAIREQVLVELAGIGAVGTRALRAAASDLPENLASDGAPEHEPEHGPDDDLADGQDLEAILPYVLPTWETAPPTVDPPPPGRLATLRRRFHELGAVNPLAVEEYAELKARLESLETQGADLRSAIGRTRTLIDELTTMIGDQFRTTFRALETAFDARFKQLFGGGFARLDLTDPSDLASTGVDIVARPPGKKAQALAMLSGGERALTAVALLFAMLEVRPVPFCVLDEVDAALDEANVGRFSDALRSLAATTQFIVITHNRGTIEAADALYGVTVGDDSVSRVISLRLDEATAIAATASGDGAGALDPVAS